MNIEKIKIIKKEILDGDKNKPFRLFSMIALNSIGVPEETKLNILLSFYKENKSLNLFFATYKNKIVGIIVGGVLNKKYFISTIYVNPQYRKQGIASKLIKVIEENASCNNKNIYLIDTSKIINFYVNQGYKLVDSDKNIYKKELFN